jgi:hypothetical protein
MTKIKKDELLADLVKAADLKDIRKATIEDAEAKVFQCKYDLASTKQARALETAKEALDLRKREYVAACDAHDAVENELRTGLTGLQMFDAAIKNGQGAVVQEAQAS